MFENFSPRKSPGPEDDPEGLHELSSPVVTIGLIGINVVVYLAMIMMGVSPVSPSPREVLPWGANFGPLTIGGQWWRLLTACFLHFGFMHLAANMYTLFLVGPFTEKLFGRHRFLVLYLVAGVGANIAGLFIHPLITSAGASGAIFGVYGGLLAFLLTQRRVIPSGVAGGVAKSAAFFLVYNLIFGFMNPQTDVTAHLCGLALGFLAGCLLARPLVPRNALYLGRTAAIAVGAVFLGVGCISFLPKGKPAEASLYRRIFTGPGVTVGSGNHLYYGGAATKTEAVRMGEGLQKAGWFQPTSTRMAFFSKDDAFYSVSFLVGRKESDDSLSGPQAAISGDHDYHAPGETQPWDDANFLSVIQRMGIPLEEYVDDKPLRILLLNPDGEQKREIRIQGHKITVGARDVIYYFGDAKKQDARALGKALQDIQYFRNMGALVTLTKESGRTDIAFVTVSVFDNPRMLAAFTAIGRKVAGSVGGLPITVHLADTNLVSRKDWKIQ